MINLHCPGASKQKGFSLLELMIAVTIGLIVMATVVTFMMASFKSNSEYVQSTRLTQELRNTLDLATRDLERAGYDDDALAYVANANVSPFSPVCVTTAASPTTCLAATPAIGDAIGSCVIYAYDRTYPNGTSTASGTPGVLDVGNGEVRGLRRSSVTTFNGQTVGVLEYAHSSGTTKPSCDGATANYSTYPATCNSTSLWCPLSDTSKLDVTALSLENNVNSVTGSGNELGIRRIDLAISGKLANLNGSSEVITRNVQSSVKIRSDCIRTTGSYSACSSVP